jgi:hypothetical protein
MDAGKRVAPRIRIQTKRPSAWLGLWFELGSESSAQRTQIARTPLVKLNVDGVQNAAALRYHT